MKKVTVQLTKALRRNGGTCKAGMWLAVPEDEAKHLVSRRVAVVVEHDKNEPKKAKSKKKTEAKQK